MTSFGRVISVRGALARVGLLADGQMPLSEVRGTVGKFVSIRCASSTIVAMITDVTSENLKASDTYIAIAPASTCSAKSSAATGRNSSAASPTIRPSATRST